MSKNDKIKELLIDISKQLPEEYKLMEKCLDEYDGFAPTKMFDNFSEQTNKAMRNKDKETLLKHLNYISKKLVCANEVELEYIDVYYVESLMFNVNNKESKWAWSIFPENIKNLYEKMWGEPKFDK